MLALVFEDELEDVAAGLQRVRLTEVEAVERFEHALADAAEVGFHLGAARQVLRLLARRADGVEDALVTFV